MATRLDNLLLGLVASLGSLCRSFHRAQLLKAVPTRVCIGRSVSANPDHLYLVDHFRWQRHVSGILRCGGPGSAGIIELVNAWNLPSALFATADGIVGSGTVGWILSAMMVFLLMSWFVTSSDSGTLVLTTILSLGDNEPPKRFRVFWGVVIGLVAAVLLVAGGLTALQTALIAAALPLSVVVLVMTAGVLISLFRETLDAQRRRR